VRRLGDADPVGQVIGNPGQRRSAVAEFIGVVPAFGVADLAGSFLVEFPRTGHGALHERDDLIPLAADLARPRQYGVDPPQAQQVGADRAAKIVGRLCGCPYTGEGFGTVGQKGLDVLPGGGVPGHLAVGVPGFVDGPAVFVAL
jgi:hypothetical protein